MIEHGIVLVKFWMHITKDEQLRRFERRQAIPYKRWKLTEEDWRNRERWDDYERAVNDMVQYTSTAAAPAESSHERPVRDVSPLVEDDREDEDDAGRHLAGELRDADDLEAIADALEGAGGGA